MERAYVGYFIIFLLVILFSIMTGMWIAHARALRREKRERLGRLQLDAQVRADRENAFREKFGQ